MTMTNTQAADLMRKVGAEAGSSVVTQVTVRAAIRQAFGETRPDKDLFEALRDAFVGAYIPKALDAHRAPDGSYRDAYIGLTEEARRERAMKAGRSYFGDRVREIYGATQRTPRAGGSQEGAGPTAKDSAEVIRALIDALVTKKGKEAARIESDAMALHAMARQAGALPSLAMRADTVAAMMSAATAATAAAEAKAAEAKAAEAAREAEIEAIVQARIEALTGGGTVGAAVAKAATGKGRGRKAG